MIDTPVILLAGAAPVESTVRAALGDLARVRVEGTVPQVLGAVRATGARIVLIDFHESTDRALEAVEQVHQAQPAVQVVALAKAKDSDLILRVMRSGAREFVVLSDADELRRVVTQLSARAAAAEPTGSIVTVFPSKGGVGATVVAINLASALLETGKRVLVVDFDLHLGDVLVSLDITSRYTIADVLHNLKRLDRDLLLGSLARHSSGIYVLAQSDHLEEAERVTTASIGTLLQFLARHFDYVICDGLRGFDEMSLATLDASNKILVLLTQDVPSIKNTQRCLDVFRRLGYDSNKVELVVNRYQKTERIDLQSIADNLHVPVAAVIANDYATVIKSVNRGTMIRDAAPRSKITEDLDKLARGLAGEATGGPKKGFLRRLFGGGNGASSEPAPAGAAQDQESSTQSPKQEGEDESKRAPEAV